MSHTYFEELVHAHVPDSSNYHFLEATQHALDVAYVFDGVTGKWMNKRTREQVEEGFWDTRLLLEYLCWAEALNPYDYIITVKHEVDKVPTPANDEQEAYLRCIRQVG